MKQLLSFKARWLTLLISLILLILYLFSQANFFEATSKTTAGAISECIIVSDPTSAWYSSILFDKAVLNQVQAGQEISASIRGGYGVQGGRLQICDNSITRIPSDGYKLGSLRVIELYIDERPLQSQQCTDPCAFTFTLSADLTSGNHHLTIRSKTTANDLLSEHDFAFTLNPPLKIAHPTTTP